MPVELQIGNLRVAGSNPAGFAIWTRSSADRAGRFTNLCRHDQTETTLTAAANAGWNYSVTSGQPSRFDSSTCVRSLARAGLPEFHHPCRRGLIIDLTNAGGTTGRASGAQVPEGRMFDSPRRPFGEGRSSGNVSPILVVRTTNNRANACETTSGKCGSNPPCLRAVMSRKLLVARNSTFAGRMQSRLQVDAPAPCGCRKA